MFTNAENNFDFCAAAYAEVLRKLPMAMMAVFKDF